MKPAKAKVQDEEVIERVKSKIKQGIENYRAASDAPAKVDVYDVIEEVFGGQKPMLALMMSASFCTAQLSAVIESETLPPGMPALIIVAPGAIPG